MEDWGIKGAREQKKEEKKEKERQKCQFKHKIV